MLCFVGNGDKINCRETIFAAQLPRNYPHHGAFLNWKNVLSCGGEAFGSILRDNLGEGS